MLILVPALKCVGIVSVELSPLVMFCFVSGEGYLMIKWIYGECINSVQGEECLDIVTLVTMSIHAVQR